MSLSNKLSVKDLDVAGKRVFIRVDFNVPLDGKTITNNQRIVAALPTIKYVEEHKPKYIVLASHLGRPNGEKKRQILISSSCYELKIVGSKVTFLNDCVGPEVTKAVENAKDGEIFLLENLRYHIEEEGSSKDKDGKKVKADPEAVKKFRQELTSLADVYINDAFGTAHRAHSSMVGLEVPQRAAGFLMSKELEYC